MGSRFISAEAHALLRNHSACDVSDALLRLKVPSAGFLADLQAYSPVSVKTIAPVSTVLFVAKGHAPEDPAPNLPDQLHWSDATEPDSFVVIKQPGGQTNAVCGGIMALRMKMCRAKGIVVAGRVRDVTELRSTGLPILAYGTSTVGAGGASVVWARQVPLDINGVTVKPGDVAFHDPDNGFVVIPRDKLQQVLDLMPKLVAADDKVKEHVVRGGTVHEAFKLHRDG
ncbi:Demethylmenaquinone methyltransferase [Ophiocordyceps camponoti-floridani]|uniref:Demethylmenaquinone methyltransferase n=1 Tax=Ophiocordyceps camponoti-floridani TaxID=2030778 RepID=A0A8H4QE12_9HYPO|nr:Demethylmenaquinone methyltransferase [Ophiocordyceps camponoti-floridani]